MKIFFDTMVYLHYKSIEEIDLIDIFGQGPHTIIIPRITLDEIDKNKDTHKLRKIRERARNRMKSIAQWKKDAEIRPGLNIEFVPKFPSEEFMKERDLRRYSQDDILIATVLHYNQNHSIEEDAVLVTHDNKLKITAPDFGVSVQEMPSEYRLPEESDPCESFTNVSPKIVVSFANSDQPKQHLTFSLAMPPRSMEEAIERKVDNIKKHYPKRNPSDLRHSALNLGIGRIPSQEYERYNTEVETYWSEYEKYVRDTWEFQMERQRTIKFTIEISNVGTALADDVDVSLEFPTGFCLCCTDDFPDMPIEPKPPEEPRHELYFSLGLDSLSTVSPSFGLSDSFLSNLNKPLFSSPNYFSIEETEQGYNVQDYFKNIKHGFVKSLPEIFLTFDSYEGASSFNCKYVISPANLPKPVIGNLHFKIEKKMG